jgi:alpha-galactosidase
MKGQRFLAVFNLDAQPASLEATWQELGLDAGSHAARDLWDGHRLNTSDRLKISLAPHASALYEVGNSPR